MLAVLVARRGSVGGLGLAAQAPAGCRSQERETVAVYDHRAVHLHYAREIPPAQVFLQFAQRLRQEAARQDRIVGPLVADTDHVKVGAPRRPAPRHNNEAARVELMNGTVRKALVQVRTNHLELFAVTRTINGVAGLEERFSPIR